MGTSLIIQETSSEIVDVSTGGVSLILQPQQTVIEMGSSVEATQDATESVHGLAPALLIKKSNDFWNFRADFGADNTGYVDCNSAWLAYLAACGDATDDGAPGKPLYIGPGDFLFNSDLNLNHSVMIVGAGRGMTRLGFGQGKGLIVEFLNTAPSVVGNGAGSRFSDMSFLGWAPDVWAANLVTTLGTIVLRVTNNGDGLAFKCTTAGTRGSSQPAWPSAPGQTVVDGTVTWTAQWCAGVWLKAAAFFRNIHVVGFGGHGFQVVADTQNSPPTNANSWSLENFIIENNNGSGLYTTGGDANRGEAANGTLSANYRGVQDHGFLGNHYRNIISQSNTLRGYEIGNANNARTMLENCYSEGDEPASRVLYPSQVIGGLFENGFTTDSDFAGLIDAQLIQQSTHTGDATNGFVGVALGTRGNFEEVQGFNAYAGNGAAETGAALRMKYRHAGVGKGYWFWDLLNSDNYVPFGIATSNQTTWPTGTAVFGNGIGLGADAGFNVFTGVGVRMVAGIEVPTYGTWRVGDTVFNSARGRGDPIAWVCSFGGSYTVALWEAVYSSVRRLTNHNIDVVLAAIDSGRVLTNRGASANRILTLPASATLVGGEIFRFRVGAAHELKILCQGGDLIRYFGVSGASLAAADIDNSLAVEYQGAGVFLVVEVLGDGWAFP